jgi:hypothetical protein
MIMTLPSRRADELAAWRDETVMIIVRGVGRAGWGRRDWTS